MVLGSLILLGFIFGGFFKLDKSGEVKIPFFKKFGVLIFNWGTFIFVVYSILSIVLDIFTPLFEQYLEHFLA